MPDTDGRRIRHRLAAGPLHANRGRYRISLECGDSHAIVLLSTLSPQGRWEADPAFQIDAGGIFRSECPGAHSHAAERTDADFRPYAGVHH